MTLPETQGPNAPLVGKVAAANLAAILYALEVCAVSMDTANRPEDSKYYRALASELAVAGGTPSDDGVGRAETD